MIQIGAPSATIDSPIEHLVACHRRVEQRLDTLVNVASHLDSERTPALLAISRSFLFLDTSGVLHTQDEESSLFPRLRPKISASEIEFIDSLEAQHGEGEEIYAELKRLAAALGVPGESSPLENEKYRACAEKLRSFYGAHIRSEDQILMSMAKRTLGDLEIAEISREMRRRRTPHGML